MASWQHTVFVRLGEEQFPLSVREAKEVIEALRQPDRGNPDMHDAQLSAAVFLERVAEELGVENPPLTEREARAIGLALTRLEISEGVTERQLDLRDAILRWDTQLDDDTT